MEKFFIIPKDHDLYQEHALWLKNTEAIRLLVKEFMDARFETTGFSVFGSEFMIAPTELDRKRYGKELKKDGYGNGLFAFKRNSKTHKEFFEAMLAAGLSYKRKPDPTWYCGSIRGGRYSSRLFRIDDVLYCSIEKEYDFPSPEAFVELKASEFWKAVEEHDEKAKANK